MGESNQDRWWSANTCFLYVSPEPAEAEQAVPVIKVKQDEKTHTNANLKAQDVSESKPRHPLVSTRCITSTFTGKNESDSFVLR